MNKKLMGILSGGTGTFIGYLVFLWGMDAFQNPLIAGPIAIGVAGIMAYSMIKFASNK